MKMKHRIFSFYIISFLYSWIVWGIGIWMFNDSSNSIILVSIGGLGPIVGGIWYLLQADTPTFKQFLKRFSFKGKYNFLIISFLLPFVIISFSYLVLYLFNSESLSLILNTVITSSLFFSILFLLIFGPLPEEISWRGIAFHDLMKTNVLKAQIIVAILWALWHVPLFFINQSYQSQLGLFTVQGLFFFIDILSISFITSWFYIKTKSITVAIIFHFAINLSGELFVISQDLSILKSMFMVIIGIFLLFKSLNVKLKVDEKL